MKMEENVSHMEIDGTVVEVNRDKFVVEYKGGKILATISGKMRTKSIRVLLGDEVRVKVSPYDTSKGFIVFRK